MITSLDHARITIPTGAEPAGREFYCDFLGLEEIPKPTALRSRGGFWLRVGDRQVHVGTEDFAHRSATRAHLAYAVTGLAGWRERLEERGIEVIEPVQIPGHDRFEFRDPFGNRIEMIEPQPATGKGRPPGGLRELQRHAEELRAAQGFDRSIERRMMYLTAELGEVAEEAIKLTGARGLDTDLDAAREALGLELYDVIWNICDLANLAGVDLQAAARRKARMNEAREW